MTRRLNSELTSQERSRPSYGQHVSSEDHQEGRESYVRSRRRSGSSTPNRSTIHSDNFSVADSAFSYARDPDTPIAGQPSELFSPQSEVTPSESSFAPSVTSNTQPPPKRSRTASIAGYTQSSVPNKRADLAGLLNPEPRMDAYSTQLTAIDFDGPAANVNPFKSEHVNSPGSDASRTLPILQPRPAKHFTFTSPVVENEQRKIDEQKKRGRRGPLESDARRAEVLEVRLLGACLRCHVMRIRCNAVKDRECTNCEETMHNARRWKIPCTRNWLRDRWTFLIPDLLRRHQRAKDSFPQISADKLGRPFKIRLTHVGDFVMDVDVVEVFDPSRSKQDFMQILTYQSGEGHGATTEFRAASALPLIPNCLPTEEAFQQMYRTTSAQLNRQASILEKRWSVNVFPWDESEPWPRALLQMVLHFRREVYVGDPRQQCPGLDESLKSCLFRFLLSWPFYILPERMLEVNTTLQPEYRLCWAELQDRMRKARNSDGDRGEWVPKFVNAWLKCAMFKLLEEHLQKLFTELEALFKLQENGGDQAKMTELDRDEAFCAIIITLIVVGMMQVKLVQGAKAWAADPRFKDEDSLPEAKRCVQIVEKEVVEFILQLWTYRFHRPQMKGKVEAGKEDKANRAANFKPINCFDYFREMHASTLSGLDTTLNLNDENLENFQSNNVSRLMLRLSQSVWRPKNPR